MALILSKTGVLNTGRKYFDKILINRAINYGSKKRAVILGIETSCDDTGCAIVDSDGNILGEALYSQQQTHIDFGGIIPPTAQDMHRENITDVCEKALRSAKLRLRDIDAIAATVKPGLPLSLCIGTNFGKYLSRIGKKPFIPIHHMEAHALTARMVEKAARRLKLRNIPEYRNLNGGSAIELAAKRATDPLQFPFEVQMAQYRNCNFSFSGLKNTVNKLTLKQERDHGIKGDTIIPDINNLCAGFQLAIAKHLCHRTKRAMEFCIVKEILPPENRTLVVSGGVACNNFIAKALSTVGDEMEYKVIRPPPRLCTDNGVMIAWNGVERWIADEGVLRDPEEIEKVDIQNKAPLGEDWTGKVTDACIACKSIKTSLLYPN